MSDLLQPTVEQLFASIGRNVGTATRIKDEYLATGRRNGCVISSIGFTHPDLDLDWLRDEILSTIAASNTPDIPLIPNYLLDYSIPFRVANLSLQRDVIRDLVINPKNPDTSFLSESYNCPVGCRSWIMTTNHMMGAIKLSTDFFALWDTGRSRSRYPKFGEIVRAPEIYTRSVQYQGSKYPPIKFVNFIPN